MEISKRKKRSDAFWEEKDDEEYRVKLEKDLEEAEGLWKRVHQLEEKLAEQQFQYCRYCIAFTMRSVLEKLNINALFESTEEEKQQQFLIAEGEMIIEQIAGKYPDFPGYYQRQIKQSGDEYGLSPIKQIIETCENQKEGKKQIGKETGEEK